MQLARKKPAKTGKIKKHVKSGDGKKRILSRKIWFPLILIAFLVIMSVGVLYGYKGYRYYIYQKRVFYLKSINVFGKGLSEKEKIEAINISGLYKGENLMLVNLKGVSRLIASLRWVKNVTVYRSFPGTIGIILNKRKAFAIVLNGESLYYVTRKGFAIERVNNADGYGYPVLTGLNENDPADYFVGIKEALGFLKLSRSSVIGGDISELHLQKDGGIIIYTKSGTMIRFGIDRYKEKMGILRKLYGEIKKLHLDYKPYINLDYKGEAVIAVKNGSRVLPANYKNSKTSGAIWK